jgi:hypothetical protein
MIKNKQVMIHRKRVDYGLVVVIQVMISLSKQV